MKTKRYSGSAIVLTILAVAAMTTVSLGVSQLVPRDFRQSQALEASLQAENASWAGVEHALSLLKAAQNDNAFFSLSDATNDPVGVYESSPLRVNCITERAACPGFDRQLAHLQNSKPITFGGLATPDVSYSLVVWHKRHGVGNTQTNGLDDGLTTSLNKLKAAPNINPILERDEVRRLDVAGVTNVAINWKPIWNNECQYDAARTKIWLLYSLLDSQNQVIERGFKQTNEFQGETIRPSFVGQAQTLSLRLLATNTSNLDPTAPDNSGGDEQKVRGCFIRYNLDTSASDAPAIDMGFDVIESTGVSGGVRRKIRVVVNRENGRLLNILDFGLACETCTGLD